KVPQGPRLRERRRPRLSLPRTDGGRRHDAPERDREPRAQRVGPPPLRRLRDGRLHGDVGIQIRRASSDSSRGERLRSGGRPLRLGLPFAGADYGVADRLRRADRASEDAPTSVGIPDRPAPLRSPSERTRAADSTRSDGGLSGPAERRVEPSRGNGLGAPSSVVFAIASPIEIPKYGPNEGLEVSRIRQILTGRRRGPSRVRESRREDAERGRPRWNRGAPSANAEPVRKNRPFAYKRQ